MPVTQLPSGPETLVIVAEFPAATPANLFAYWTQPALVQAWWPQRVEIEPHVGGNYHFSWPAMAWHLRGRYLAYQPGERLAFTWRWDHDPSTDPERIVTVHVESLPGGNARLRLTHGPYASTPADQEMRLEHHLAGWLHILPRLQQVVASG